MKLFAAALLMALPVLAQAGTLDVVNTTSKSVSVGEYRGIRLPSICENGSSYGFCWEEVNVKLRPYRGARDIQGQVSVTVGQGDRETFIEIDGTQRYSVAPSCEPESPYVQAIEGEVRLSELKDFGICLKTGRATLVID